MAIERVDTNKSLDSALLKQRLLSVCKGEIPREPIDFGSEDLRCWKKLQATGNGEGRKAFKAILDDNSVH